MRPNEKTLYPEGDDIYLWFTDLDANRDPSAVETITLIVRNETTGDFESITLTETGPDTGIFTTLTPLPSSPSAGLGAEDGILYARAGDSLYVHYVDPLYGDSCSDTATLAVPSETKVLYLTDAADGVPEEPQEPAVQYKRQITFNNSAGTSDLTNFPVLVHLTSANFDFGKANSDGSDIRFYDADGTTPLSYEIESWDATAGEAHIWVKVPQIDKNSNSDSIWMHYGDSTLADAQTPAAVWSDNFRAVWHMDETSGTMVADSSGNWNGTATASVVRDVAGKVNGADDYPDGANDYTSLPSGEIVPVRSPFTFESWLYLRTPSSHDRIFMQDAANRNCQVVWSDTMIQVSRNDGGSVAAPIKGAIPVPATGSWFHFAWVFNGTSDTLYINGVAGSTTPSHSSTTTGNGNNYIGTRVPSGNPFDGRLDEMRVAGTARSADWIRAQYASMNGTFATLGNEESFIPAPPMLHKRQITFNNSTRTEALENFPVLIHLTGADFDFTKTKCDGRDIRFFDADGVTPLSYEIESWDIATQQAYIWVKVPQVDAASSTDSIWMHYGNPALADAQAPAAVWSDGFSAVWHMDETSGTMVSDSTGNGWDGTASANVVRNADGMVNGADEYPDGLNNHTRIKSGAMASLVDGFTFESWVYVGATADFDRIFTHNAANHQFQVVWATNKLQVARNDGTYSYPRLTAAAPAARGSWHHFVWVFDGTSDHLYINGAPVVNEAPTSSGTANGENSYNYIGARDANNKHFKGKLDEMRLATAVRSAAWIDAQYAAMTGDFAALGTEVSVPLEINFAAAGVTNDAMDRIDPVAAGDTTTAHTVILDCTCEWGYKKQLSFRNASRAEDLDNFPVLVHLTVANFDFTKAQSAGQDIRFFDADGTTALAYEIESWDATAQQAHIWVRVPRIDASSSTDSIWMEYGNPEVADAQQPAAVWSSGFEAVWHMDETSGTTVADSTGNGWNATASANVVRNAAGQVNGADEYPDGTTSYAKITKPGEIVPVTSGFTYETWVRVGASANYDRLFTQDGDYRHLQVVWSPGKVEVARNDGTVNYGITKAAAPVASDVWTHFAWVFDGTKDTLYVNGVPASTTTSFGSTYIGDGYNYIGALDASRHNFNGRLDETRIASTARSAAWINAQHASMADSLIDYGAEQPIPSKHVTSVSFTQSPDFCKDFVMTAGGNLAAIVYAAVVKGAMPHNPVISATLKHGTTQFADLGTPTATFVGTGTGGEAIYRLDWSAVLGGKVTVPAGQAVTLEITTAAGTPFSVLYDSADYPSRVSLPAETVIDIESLAIYDAPYPGGSPVGAIVAGATAYVRATVSDPFGAYDITGLDISIPEAGVTASLNDAEVVDVTSCTKTYEYVWRPPAEGSYSVAVTAHEGTEGIKDTAATRLDVTFLDFGTPSTTEFTITNNGVATDTYDPDQTVYIRVTDPDQNTNPDAPDTITVIVTTSTGDTETITLTEIGPNTGIFTAEVPASSSTVGSDEDGTLYAPPGTVLDVVYVDPNDPTDTSSDTAIVTQPSGTSGLAIQKQLADPSVTAVVVGDEVVYRVRVANTGTTVLDPVTLTDTYPIQLKFVSASPTADIHNATQRQVTWNNVGPLAVGGYREFELTFKAQTVANTAVNSATATYPGGSQSDSAAVEIVNAGHTVTKTLLSPSGGTASYGDIVEYRIVVTNTGTTRITLLPLEDAFSAAYLAYVPGSATTEPDGVGAGLLFWENIAAPGGLDAGGSITIDLKFKVVGAGTPIVNTAIADYSEDEHGNPVPPARDSDTNLVTTAGLISGHVWNDLNENGIGDSGEPRLKDVEIKLYTAGGDLIATTTTLGKDGYYEFPNLPDGDYIIVEVDPPGYKSTGDTQGVNDNRIAVTVTGGGVYPNNDFCDVRMPIADYASISGTVWNDANRNGTADPDEVGVKGVTVALYKDANNNGVVDPGEEAVDYRQTDINGDYAFSGLPAGNYIVVEIDPPGYQSTGDVVGANDNQIPVSVNAGDKVTGRDFFDARSGTIEGHVWHDLNGDGVFDEADKAAGLEGVTVTLKTNGVVVATTTTAADGSYTFDNLPPGDYEIVQTDLPDWSSTMDADGTNDNSITVSLLDGGRSANNNFLDTLPAMVRGYVFIDTVNDLLRAKGDTTVTNALVRLMVDGVVIASTNTDEVGYYEFGSVPPGVVSVLVSRVNATLVDVPAEGHAAYDDERRNRAIASGEDAVIVHTVVSGAGILAGHPAETLNFGFRDHPLSTAIDIRLHATPEGVTIQLSTVNEAGCGDIVIYAWIDNAWAEVGRVPAWLVVGEGANTYSVTASRLVAGSAYYLRVIDEAGNLHLSLTPVTVDSLQVEAVRLDLQSVTLRFNTEPGRRYQVEVSTDLVTWRTEYVSAPTAKGWTPFATEPFMAGPGTHTEVRVPRNERSRAFFNIRRIE